MFFFHGGGCSVLKSDKHLCSSDSLDISSFDSSEDDQICSWDYAGNGFWCTQVDIFKTALSLKHIPDYEEVEVEDIRNLCDLLAQKGVFEKIGVTKYKVNSSFKSKFCSKILW